MGEKGLKHTIKNLGKITKLVRNEYEKEQKQKSDYVLLSCGTTKDNPNHCRSTGEELSVCVSCHMDDLKRAEQRFERERSDWVDGIEKLEKEISLLKAQNNSLKRVIEETEKA